jgi:DNA-binding beta-propeller fold protein YncE
MTFENAGQRPFVWSGHDRAIPATAMRCSITSAVAPSAHFLRAEIPLSGLMRGGINGPWDMTAAEHDNGADLFVTNVLNGTVAAGGAIVNRGTVVRIRVRLPHDGDGLPVASRPVVIASGFAEHTDPAALVVGPTGLTLGRHDDTLYVADTASNRISAIPDASTRERTAFTGADLTSGGHLNSPLGLALAPNGDVLSVNAADGLILETTPAGAQVATVTLDATGVPPGSGTLFGLAVTPDSTGVYFVDDGTNTLKILH